MVRSMYIWHVLLLMVKHTYYKAWICLVAKRMWLALFLVIGRMISMQSVYV
jgi:hypothetical protein